VKEARYLIRLANRNARKPSDQAALLQQVRALALPTKGKAINLRVTPVALEFDLFCPPEMDVEPFLSLLKPLGKVITRKRLDLPPPPVNPQSIVAEARQLFNEHRFWEVHEVLEGLWKTLKDPAKRLVQGLILVAAALVHVQKNEMKVVWLMLERALACLENQPPDYYGWDVAKFRDHFLRVLAQKNIDFPTV
jgi:hypothetical protein